MRDITVDGPETGTTDGETFTRPLEPRESTVTYVFDGAVTSLGEVNEVSWPVASGWDVPLDRVGVEFLAPSPSESIMCTTGSVGAGKPRRIPGHAHSADPSESDLAPQERVDFTVQLPVNPVQANAVFEDTFSLTRLSR